MKQYCLKCGNPTEYSVVKPNFCSKCGNSFQKQIEKTVIKSKIDFDIENEDDPMDEKDVQMPNITSLEIEEIIIPKNEKETLGSILKKNKSVNKETSKRIKKNKISKKESEKMLEDLMSEAKTLRHKK